MTPRDLYTQIIPHALAAYAQKTADMESAKQMAHALAKETVDECARLGILGAALGEEEVRRHAVPVAGRPGIPSFAETQPAGAGSAPIVPPGAPQQPAQHYNHVARQAQESSPQAGVMSTVTQVPTPEGYSALGTGGVINQPVQHPNSRDQVVNPSMQPMIPHVGGSGTKFVPEKISH